MSQLITLLKTKQNEIKELSKASRAYLYFKNYRRCLLTGNQDKYSIETFFRGLKDTNWKELSENRIIHLFYELDFVDLKNISEEHPLAIIIDYSEERFLNINSNPSINLELVESPVYDEYQNRFQEVQQNLRAGNCYQINLTERLKYKTENSPKDFIDKFVSLREKLSEFAHLTYIEDYDLMFFSNSPESLFNLEVTGKLKISSRPIKGTIPFDRAKDSFDNTWNELVRSKKDEAELYMIADLIRNDLAGIEEPVAKIENEKLPLEVPGLLHQYSLISVECSHKTSLYNILKSLFPGGSITGAPKKRVRKLIRSIETSHRGIYCGSTVYISKEGISGSINIRTAEIDFDKKELVYGSGGGITVKSEPELEFDELNNKAYSFIQLFL